MEKPANEVMPAYVDSRFIKLHHKCENLHEIYIIYYDDFKLSKHFYHLRNLLACIF
jgi:hypothetical protein